jgi:hypothetical protein
MFVADLVVVLAMVAASTVGALALPPDGMVPVDLVPGAGVQWLPKSIGLAVWPAVGVTAYLAVQVSLDTGRPTGHPRVALTVALALLLLVQTVAILVAVSRRGRP